MEDPKNPESSSIFDLYKTVAGPQQVLEMSQKLLAGGYGWGHAKKDLLDAITTKFGDAREKYHYFMNHKNEIDEVLHQGAEKAKAVAQATLGRVREKMGY